MQLRAAVQGLADSLTAIAGDLRQAAQRRMLRSPVRLQGVRQTNPQLHLHSLTVSPE